MCLDCYFQSRIIRVLNLWQKNNVFPVIIIQPLLDITADPTNADNILAGEPLEYIRLLLFTVLTSKFANSEI